METSSHGIPTPYNARPINEIMADISQEIFRPTSDKEFQALIDELHNHYTQEEISRFGEWMNKKLNGS